MSERVGSDIEQLWILNENSYLSIDSVDSKSFEYVVIEIQGHSMSDPTFSDINFENKMVWVWTTLKFFSYSSLDPWYVR